MKQLFGAILGAALLAASPAAAQAPTKPGAKPAAARPAPAKRLAGAVVKPAPLPDSPEIAELRRAFLFAYPIYEMLKTRDAQLARTRLAGLPNAVNMLFPKVDLADASTRDVTTPNNDTLYGSAWLDLAQGPVILEVPAMPGRYNSAALMSITTDNAAILGTRTGGQGGRYALVGPAFSGETPAGTELIRLPSNDSWLLIRVLVNGPADQEAAATALSAFRLEPTAEAPIPTTAEAPPAPNAKTFLTAVNEALQRSASNASLTNKANQFSSLGLSVNWETLPPATQELWAKSLPALRAELAGGLASIGETVQGWSYPRAGIGDYGTDDDLRAKVALGGLAALPRAEALYLSARTDKDGQPLDGGKAYRVRIPPRLPVGGFWSLTMYQQEADGSLFFVANDINRFAVGDRSKHLRYDRDASYELFVQNAKPQGERVVNWLPAPKGRFVLIFRAYLPKGEFLDGSFRLPPVEIGEAIP